VRGWGDAEIEDCAADAKKRLKAAREVVLEKALGTERKRINAEFAETAETQREKERRSR